MVKQNREQTSFASGLGVGFVDWLLKDGITEEGFNRRCLLKLTDRLGQWYPPSVSRRTNKARQPRAPSEGAFRSTPQLSLVVFLQGLRSIFGDDGKDTGLGWLK
jgi:hypothetical protein